jgi:hypothetical protein
MQPIQRSLASGAARLPHAHLLFVGHLLQTPPIAFVILTAARAAATISAPAPIAQRVADGEREQRVKSIYDAVNL